MPDSTAIHPGRLGTEPAAGPRLVTRGSTPPTPLPHYPLASGPFAPRFDWYAATIREDPLTITQALCEGLGGSAVVAVPHNGYTSAQSIVVNDSKVATVFYGGRNGWPHAFASSDATPAFVEVVRRLWPEHRVTRMDASIDFDEPGAFERLLGVVRDVREAHGLSYDMAGAWDDPGSEAGRTFYLGSRRSAVFARLYEKGKQLRSLELAEGYEPSLDLTRLELQVRPDGPAREVAAAGAPVEAYGYSVWAMDLLQRVAGLDVERVHIRQPRRSDLDRAIQAMSEQYARHLVEYADELGGAEELGRELIRRARVERAKRDRA